MKAEKTKKPVTRPGESFILLMVGARLILVEIFRPGAGALMSGWPAPAGLASRAPWMAMALIFVLMADNFKALHHRLRAGLQKERGGHCGLAFGGGSAILGGSLDELND